jgi:hypothetical protein
MAQPRYSRLPGVTIYNNTPLVEKNSVVRMMTGDVKASIKFPTTSLRWRSGNYSSKNKYILITSNTDGMITQWNTRTGM